MWKNDPKIEDLLYIAGKYVSYMEAFIKWVTFSVHKFFGSILDIHLLSMSEITWEQVKITPTSQKVFICSQITRAK